MYVTKRGNKYRAWERIVIDGVPKRISVTMDRDTPQSRKKAQKQLEARAARPTNNMTYSGLVTAYIEYQKATLKMSTWVRNEASLKRLETNFGKNKKIEDMTAGYITAKLLEKTKDPGTFNEYLKRVKAMFRWAYRNDYLSSSACVDKIKPLKEDETESQKVADKYLEASELEKILEAATPYQAAVFEFLALSGLRIGELIALDDEDVTDTDIIVRKTYDSNNGVINTPKTAAGWRYVHIQPELRDCIRRIRKQSNVNRLLTRQRPPYFVVSSMGGRLSYANTNRDFKAVCVRVLGRELTLHALRHTHVALMAESVDIEAITRRIGHSNSKITKEIYYHCTEKQREKDNAAFDSVSVLTKKVIPL